MRVYLPLLLALLAVGSASAQVAPRSFEASVYGTYAYHDDFGGLGSAPGLALTYGYGIGPKTQLGVTLVRYSPWLTADRPFHQISYGLEYKHFATAPDAPWAPWVSYSLLLDQSLRQGDPGRGMAHQSRLSAGANRSFGAAGALTLEAGWTMSSYASFDAEKASTLGGVFAGLGWRWAF